MATTPGRIRPWRYLAAFAGIIVVLYALVFFTGDKPTPKLGIDLQGGTRVTLTARTEAGGEPPREQLLQAQTIIEQRVNGLGVSGAEVVLDGTNITITVPGEEGDQARSLGQTAQLRFREVVGGPVAAAPHRSGRPRRPGSGGPSTGDTPSTVSPTGAPSDATPDSTPDSTLPPQGRGGPDSQHAGRARRVRPGPAVGPALRAPGHTRPGRRYRGDPGGSGRPDRRRGDRRGPRHPPEHGRHRAGPGPAGARLRGDGPAARLRRPDAPAGQLQPGRHREVRARPELPRGHADRQRAGRTEQPGCRVGHRRVVQERRRGDLGRLHVAERRQERGVRARRRGRLRPDHPGPDLRQHPDHRAVQPGRGPEPRGHPALRLAAAVVRVVGGPDRVGLPRASRRWRPV